MAIELNAQQLTELRLPNLLYGPLQTTSNSIHPLEFKAALVHWKNLKKKFAKNSYQPNRAQKSLGMLLLTLKVIQIIFIMSKYIAAMSIVLWPRFGQNIGHIMIAVYQSLNINIRFGDCKASSDSSLEGTVPDIIILNNAGQIKSVGELKTPWAHRLHSIIIGSQEPFKKLLGQFTIALARCILNCFNFLID
jgi:hypothetical protein